MNNTSNKGVSTTKLYLVNIAIGDIAPKTMLSSSLHSCNTNKKHMAEKWTLFINQLLA